MRSLFHLLVVALALLGGAHAEQSCVSFTVGPGTGCSWMCNYCASSLGTSNYYFTDNVCVYESGQGCVGNPVAGKQYTCCAVASQDAKCDL